MAYCRVPNKRGWYNSLLLADVIAHFQHPPPPPPSPPSSLPLPPPPPPPRLICDPPRLFGTREHCLLIIKQRLEKWCNLVQQGLLMFWLFTEARWVHNPCPSSTSNSGQSCPTFHVECLAKEKCISEKSGIHPQPPTFLLFFIEIKRCTTEQHWKPIVQRRYVAKISDFTTWKSWSFRQVLPTITRCCIS